MKDNIKQNQELTFGTLYAGYRNYALKKATLQISTKTSSYF